MTTIDATFVTIAAAQAFLERHGVFKAETTLRRWLRQGRLRGRQLGVQWYIRRDSLVALVAPSPAS